MTTPRSLGLALAVTVGLAGAALAQGTGRFDGQYSGDLALARVIDGDCTEPPPGSLYPLTIAGGQVRFAYAPRFATTLVGTVDAKGNIRASAPLKNGTAQMSGHVEGGRVTASIVSPSCVYSFQTK